MYIAVFVYGDRFVVAYVEDGFRSFAGLQVFDLTSPSGLQVDERNVMSVKHGVGKKSYLYLDFPFPFAHDYREVLLHHGIFSGRDEFLHLLTAAFDVGSTVHELDNNISANCAEVKFCCHNYCCLNVNDAKVILRYGY